MPGKASLAGLLLVAGGAGISLNSLMTSPAYQQGAPLPFSSLCPSTNTSLPSSLPHLYLVTPTYTRSTQEAELTRLAQTLLHVPSLTWLVVEDSPRVSPRLETILARYPQIHIVVMAVAMPDKYREAKGAKPRGVAQRNLGVSWVLSQGQEGGVLYFADDDNTYDLRLFRELRLTRDVALFPVGLVTQTGISSPIVKEGRIVGFFDGWIGGRKFPVDMAGLAVRVETLRKAASKFGQMLMPFSPGYEEDGFLRQLGVNPSSAQPLAANCTQVLVWHTKTITPGPPKKVVPHSTDQDKLQNTNLPSLLASLSVTTEIIRKEDTLLSIS